MCVYYNNKTWKTCYVQKNKQIKCTGNITLKLLTPKAHIQKNKKQNKNKTKRSKKRKRKTKEKKTQSDLAQQLFLNDKRNTIS